MLDYIFGKLTTKNQMLHEQIKEFKASENVQWALKGRDYYEVKHDIRFRKLMKYTSTGYIEDKTRANNKLMHPFAKDLVDEKVNYLLSKPFTFDSDNEQYIENVKSVLSVKKLQYFFEKLGYEASNKGVAWVQTYIDEKGKFKYMMIPTEQCMPLYTDGTKTELSAMVRIYPKAIFKDGKKVTIEKVEYWTDESVEYYIIEDDKLVSDYEQVEDGPFGHYKKGGKWMSWGKVPFVPFRNNNIEYPDVRFIKTLIDNYDMSRSEVANFIEDVKNLIFVLYGYEGESLAEFMNNLNLYRAVNFDSKEDGGLETLNPKMDIDAALKHYEQLKRDIKEFGQGVTKDLDKFGSSPSGIALKFLYSSLDLKCNALETSFKRGFEEFLYFVNVYLAETGSSTAIGEVDIIFNRDVMINETEAIENCNKSVGTLSKETILSMHPWVKDVQSELDRLSKEEEEAQKKANAYNDFIPNSGGVGNGE